MSGFNPQISFNSQFSSPISRTGMAYGRVSNVGETDNKISFKDTMCNMVSNINDTMNKPDDLLAKAASGTGEVDVHDVMIAMSQAEVTLTVATNAVSKVIQAYDKIVQIQV